MRGLVFVAALLSVPAMAQVPATMAPAGAPVSCIQLSQVRGTRVVDDRTIDFIMAGRRTLRNTLPASCPMLGFQRAFSYEVSIPQLCSVDIITVVNQGGGPQWGARCGLGKFVPFEPLPSK